MTTLKKQISVEVAEQLKNEKDFHYAVAKTADYGYGQTIYNSRFENDKYLYDSIYNEVFDGKSVFQVYNCGLLVSDAGMSLRDLCNFTKSLIKSQEYNYRVVNLFSDFAQQNFDVKLVTTDFLYGHNYDCNQVAKAWGERFFAEGYEVRAEAYDEGTEYIDKAFFAKELSKLYHKEIDDRKLSTEELDFLEVDELIGERVAEKVWKVNLEMYKYLHGSHSIENCFADIDINYPHDRGRKWDAKGYKLVQNMIARLDAQSTSRQAKKDRKWLVGWYFYTVGTYNIKYLFGEEIDSLLSEFDDMEKEYAEQETL